MKSYDNIGALENLHRDFVELLEKKKLHPKSAHYLSCLDIDTEQLWVLRFYREHNILPTIKQAREIKETYDKKKLTLKKLYAIMETSLQPKKLVFNYSDFIPFFPDDTPPDKIKKEVIKVLSYWKNNMT